MAHMTTDFNSDLLKTHPVVATNMESFKIRVVKYTTLQQLSHCCCSGRDGEKTD